MKVVIQRCSQASVLINKNLRKSIDYGMLILLGITHNDTIEDIDWLVKKILQIRIFRDEAGTMNRSLKDINGQILIISQFTLYASTKKGNRPSYMAAAKPEISIPLYETFIKNIKSAATSLQIKTGEFGAQMDVSLVNDGPVTIIIDSKNRT